MIEYLLGCSLLVVSGIVGWYAHRRSERRARRPQEAKTGPSVLQATVTQAEQVAASEESSYKEAEQRVPHEWDGGPLRPNLNRQIALGRGLR